MTTTDTVLLIVLTVELSLFILLGIALVIMLMRLVSALRTVVDKAEDVVDTAESVAETFKDTKGKLSLFKLIFNIVKMVQGKKK